MTISEGEALEALREAMFGPAVEIDQGATTAAEMCEAWGLTASTVRRRIKEMLGNGQMERVMKRVVRTNGVPVLVDAYRLVA